MHLCVVGTGLSASLLAWRVRQAYPGSRVELIGRPAPPSVVGQSATRVSPGLSYGYAADLERCRLAVASLVELRASRVLSGWAAYREIGSAHLRAEPAEPVSKEVLGHLEQQLPGSVEVLPAGQLPPQPGWSALPGDAQAVLERHAGYLSADRWRRELLRELDRHGVQPVESTAELRVGSGARCQLGSRPRQFDAVVVAAGRWTSALLARSGLPVLSSRPALVQYGLYQADGPVPPAFVDETTGLYGRPQADGRVLLGLLGRRPDQRQAGADRQRSAVRFPEDRVRSLAAARLPRLRLGRLRHSVTVEDCLTDPVGPLLRAVPGAAGVFTFAGGAGASTQTALAASRLAAHRLLVGAHQEQLPEPRRPEPAGLGREGGCDELQ